MRPAEAIRAAIIDVGIGNIDSVAAALRYLGVETKLVSKAEDLESETHLILPGVGAFRAGMAALEAHGLIAPLRAIARNDDSGHRLLGICLGMQLLGEYSEEGDCDGLGIMPFRVNRIRNNSSTSTSVKVPHVGFSNVHGYTPNGLFADLGKCADFYFTHSFAVYEINDSGNVGLTHYGDDLIAAFEVGRICGAQFHPEKSQANGLQLFKNFLSDNQCHANG